MDLSRTHRALDRRKPDRSQLVKVAIAIVIGLGCTPSPSSAPKPSSSVGEPPPTASGIGDGRAHDATRPPPQPVDAPIGDCAEATAEYLARRRALDTCERDSDCSEIWPGLCPHGPFYVHRDAEVEPVWALGRRIEAQCEVPECEPPMELGIAHCDAGRCRSGREPPTTTEFESCWDRRETHLRAGGTAQAETCSTVRGTTPLLVITPAHPGRLQLSVEWPITCTDCTLLVSEHNSGMARLLDTTPTNTRETTRDGASMRSDTIELAVTPGPYFIVGKSLGPAVEFFVHAQLVDDAGAPGRVSRHGQSWTRVCEG